jgi:hypothetical protein
LIATVLVAAWMPGSIRIGERDAEARLPKIRRLLEEAEE